ncbi:YfhH family protein [Halobacillus salinarum]|uniref:YfhH family protein n=1 Tax=Halobacillus salinarum TaxID=2932257 RepID=A0ABY4EHX0_9BACI|nr:YfhH family protein [Halobacillus salinarum]UOQ43663.1 YfhH family protein [Halobacillus salinarum]
MERRYSQYTTEELRSEIAELTEKAQKAEQLGMVNEFAVHERKIIMAKSYMLDPTDFKAGEIYGIDGDPEHKFYIEYMNGIFAWGYRFNPKEEERKSGEEEALPIALLE